VEKNFRQCHKVRNRQFYLVRKAGNKDNFFSNKFQWCDFSLKAKEKGSQTSVKAVKTDFNQ
jgi:hypothetical protein